MAVRSMLLLNSQVDWRSGTLPFDLQPSAFVNQSIFMSTFGSAWLSCGRFF
jgi:hypothetical protein